MAKSLTAMPYGDIYPMTAAGRVVTFLAAFLAFSRRYGRDTQGIKNTAVRHILQKQEA